MKGSLESTLLGEIQREMCDWTADPMRSCVIQLAVQWETQNWANRPIKSCRIWGAVQWEVLELSEPPNECRAWWTTQQDCSILGDWQTASMVGNCCTLKLKNRKQAYTDFSAELNCITGLWSLICSHLVGHRRKCLMMKTVRNSLLCGPPQRQLGIPPNLRSPCRCQQIKPSPSPAKLKFTGQMLHIPNVFYGVMIPHYEGVFLKSASTSQCCWCSLTSNEWLQELTFTSQKVPSNRGRYLKGAPCANPSRSIRGNWSP